MCVKLCDRVYIYLNTYMCKFNTKYWLYTYMCKSNTKYWLITDKMRLVQFMII